MRWNGLIFLLSIGFPQLSQNLSVLKKLATTLVWGLACKYFEVTAKEPCPRTDDAVVQYQTI